MALSAGPGFELRVAYEAAREETRDRADGAYVEDKAAQATASCLSEGLSQHQSVPQASVNQSLGARWPAASRVRWPARRAWLRQRHGAAEDEERECRRREGRALQKRHQRVGLGSHRTQLRCGGWPGAASGQDGA